MISSDQVKFMRLQHGWSQQQLAAITDISVRTIQRIEKQGECSLESKMALASAFGVAPNELDTLPNVALKTHSQSLNAWLFIALCAGILTLVYLFAGTLQILLAPKIMLFFLLFFISMSIVSSGIENFFGVFKIVNWLIFNRTSIEEPRCHIKTISKQIGHCYAAGVGAFLINCLILFSTESHLSMEIIYIQIIVGIILSTFYSVILSELILRPLKQRLELELSNNR